HLLTDPGNAGVQRLVGDLNGTYRERAALWQRDTEPDGFTWLQNDAALNASAFLRWSADGERVLACVANLSPVPRDRHRLGLPVAGRWREVLNTDSEHYGGSGVGNLGAVIATDDPLDGQPCSAPIALPPLAVVWLEPDT
ncbi:MAG: alpha amylase C-terminal domain-containing protein, partial [Actinobacteria bacterium]|nr:alpha amylase C-terminal domain-containing protein [Actinomycetota bacterium]